MGYSTTQIPAQLLLEKRRYRGAKNLYSYRWVRTASSCETKCSTEGRSMLGNALMTNYELQMIMAAWVKNLRWLQVPSMFRQRHQYAYTAMTTHLQIL
ncbi:hypothetical protein K439DRAFT_369754 [Ramaria rubella]|nr:hypothetical protein K439DRAFT_369754 [Ramaria rubella]